MTTRRTRLCRKLRHRRKWDEKSRTEVRSSLSCHPPQYMPKGCKDSSRSREEVMRRYCQETTSWISNASDKRVNINSLEPKPTLGITDLHYLTILEEVQQTIEGNNRVYIYFNVQLVKMKQTLKKMTSAKSSSMEGWNELQ